MRFYLCLALLTMLPLPALAADWPQWRGPTFNGASDEPNLPADIAPDRHVRWTADLPGPAAATPIVTGRHVLLSSTDALDPQKLHALCFDLQTGQNLWQVTIPAIGHTKFENSNDQAAPSPVTDGRWAWFFYGAGQLIAFDLQGNPKWSRQIAHDHGNLAIKYGYSASPLLYQDKLFISVLRRNTPYRNEPAGAESLPSVLLALDPNTGCDLFRHERPTDATDECMESYATPIPATVNQQPALILAGGDYVTAHRTADGRELWRFPLNPAKRPLRRLIPSPVATNLVYVASPRGGKNPLLALDTNPPTPNPTEPRWTFAPSVPDVCTPLLYRDRLYVLDGAGLTMTCLNPHTGRQIWQQKLPITHRDVFRASPTGADGKIYCINRAGDLLVLAAADQFQLLATAFFPSRPVQSTIVVAHACILIRTADKLYCFDGTAKSQKQAPKTALTFKYRGID